jgi:opacity protein-like surface antigen
MKEYFTPSFQFKNVPEVFAVMRRDRTHIFLVAVLAVVSFFSISTHASADSSDIQASSTESPSPPAGIWNAGVGSGLRKGTLDADFEAGAGPGLKIRGTLSNSRTHDLAMTSIGLGYILNDAAADGPWYSGNWELRLELFGGFQFSPDTASFIGPMASLQYNFVTGTRFVPYVGFGLGISETDIGRPDLSTTFEFNLDGKVGVYYFLTDNLALTLNGQYIHFSNAGIETPNRGVNTLVFSTGVKWFF